jgi:hypothetical protein
MHCCLPFPFGYKITTKQLVFFFNAREWMDQSKHQVIFFKFFVMSNFVNDKHFKYEVFLSANCITCPFLQVKFLLSPVSEWAQLSNSVGFGWMKGNQNLSPRIGADFFSRAKYESISVSWNNSIHKWISKWKIIKYY